MFFKNNPVFIIVLYLTLIKIKLNMEQSFKKGVVLNLASLVEYSEGANKKSGWKCNIVFF